MLLCSQRLELMRHIYNGEEGDFTDLTIAPEPMAACPQNLGKDQASNLAALPPRCVFSCLTQNMCVGSAMRAVYTIKRGWLLLQGAQLIFRGCVRMGARGAMAPMNFQRVAFGTHEIWMSKHYGTLEIL